MARSKWITRIGQATKLKHPKKNRMNHNCSSRTTKKRKPKLKKIILEDPKDNFLHPKKQMKHRRITRVLRSPSNYTSKTRPSHKSTSKSNKTAPSRWNKKGFYFGSTQQPTKQARKLKYFGSDIKR